MQQSIIITGASRGIGAATAIAAAQKGYAVCVNYRNNHIAAQHVVQSITKAGGNAIAVQADVSSEQQVEQLFTQADQLGSLCGLVNNAGILHRQMPVEEMDAARINNILNTNVTGCFLCSKQAIKRLAYRYGGNGGAIVNVSSIAARTGSPGEYVDYAASKGAVDTFTIGLSKELADQGIRVNGVRPAFIYTDIHASGGEPGRVDRIKDSIPLKRGGQPFEVANAIIWLLSNEASYTTGTFIDVTGGR